MLPIPVEAAAFDAKGGRVPWELSALMDAAARFSDLPELRNLRQAFQERYGNSLDHFINQEFAERMDAKPSTMEKKVNLMQDIASEYSIAWDAKAFEHRMSRPPSILPDDQPKHYGSPHPASGNTEILDNKFAREKETTPEVSLKQGWESSMTRTSEKQGTQ